MPDRWMDLLERGAMVLVALAFCTVDGAALLARRPVEEAVLLGSTAALIVAVLAKTLLCVLAHATLSAERPRRPGRPSGVTQVKSGALDAGTTERG